MALNTTGPISIGGSTAGQSVNLEFGRSANAPTSMSQLYRGGAIVPNATANNSVPTSGAISLANLRGAVNRVSITVPITVSQNDYVFNTAKAPGYIAGISDVVFDISAGVVLSASSLGAYAGNVDASWAAGDTVRINNSGTMAGVGGAGGAGGGPAAPVAGGAGGLAFIAQRAVALNNLGVIGAGGGGGGGGARVTGTSGGGKDPVLTHSGSGGGGGGGQSNNALNAAGGAGGAAVAADFTAAGAAGAAGTISGAGGGGAGGIANGFTGGAGGAGGTRGVDGGTGGAAGAAGGLRGFAITGNANITYITTGTILGRLQ